MSASARKRCDCSTSRPPARATSWSCRWSATSGARAGCRGCIPPSTRPTRTAERGDVAARRSARRACRDAAADVARPFASVMPGLHVPEAGSHRVVWWDPRRPRAPRLDRPLAEQDPRSRHRRPRRGRTRGVAGVARPPRGDDRAGCGGITPGAGGHRVGAGRRRGRGIGPRSRWWSAGVTSHRRVRAAPLRDADPRARLAVVGLDATGARRSPTTPPSTRGCSAPPSTSATPPSRWLRAALAHPLLRRAAAAALEGRVRREVPGGAALADGTLLESVVDLAFQEAGAWTVVDFKTDAELAPRLEVYRRQVALYVQGGGAGDGPPRAGRPPQGVRPPGVTPCRGGRRRSRDYLWFAAARPSCTDETYRSKRRASRGARKSVRSPRAPCRS